SPQFGMSAAQPFWYKHLHRLAKQLGTRVAEHRFRLAIDHFNYSRVIDHHDGIRRGLHHTPQPLLTSLQRLLREPALTEVARQLDEAAEIACLAPNWGEGYVRPEMRSVFPNAPALVLEPPGSHGQLQFALWLAI